MSKHVCALPQPQIKKPCLFYLWYAAIKKLHDNIIQILSNNTNKEIYWKPVKQAKIPLTRWWSQRKCCGWDWRGDTARPRSQIPDIYIRLYSLTWLSEEALLHFPPWNSFWWQKAACWCADLRVTSSNIYHLCVWFPHLSVKSEDVPLNFITQQLCSEI